MIVLYTVPSMAIIIAMVVALCGGYGLFEALAWVAGALRDTLPIFMVIALVCYVFCNIGVFLGDGSLTAKWYRLGPLGCLIAIALFTIGDMMGILPVLISLFTYVQVLVNQASATRGDAWAMIMTAMTLPVAIGEIVLVVGVTGLMGPYVQAKLTLAVEEQPTRSKVRLGSMAASKILWGLTAAMLAQIIMSTMYPHGYAEMFSGTPIDVLVLTFGNLLVSISPANLIV